MWLDAQNNCIQVDYAGITKFFNQTELADRKIVAVSIVGDSKKGKSFFMNYCLRFMYANVSEVHVMLN